MDTNPSLAPALVDPMVAVSGESTKKAAITLVMKEFNAGREQKRVSDLFGNLELYATVPPTPKKS